MTEDEKIQRIKAENRHNQLVEALRDITVLLKGILEQLKNEKKEEKKEGE